MFRSHTFTLPILALIAFAFGSLGRAVEIPFDFVDGYIVLKSRLAPDGEVLNFVLDSGAGASALSMETARRLHVPLGARQPVRGIDMETAAYQLHDVEAVSLFENAVHTPVQLAVDLTNASQLCRVPIHGLLGAGFFANRIVQIDYAAKQIRFLDQSPVQSACTRLPLKSLNGVFCVPVSVNGSKTRWTRLDTGCNDALHWVIPRPVPQKKNHDVSIGFITDETNVALTRLQIGGITLNHIETSLHATPLFPGESGLLGNGILSRYVATIDAVRGELTLRPPNQ